MGRRAGQDAADPAGRVARRGERHEDDRAPHRKAPGAAARGPAGLEAPVRAAARPALVFPGPEGGLWTKTTYDNWRKRAFDRARAAAEAEEATPYALRHSFASLLLHEGRSVVYVARQLGHDARLTLTTYGHVMDELEEQPRLAAEDAIRAARESSCARGVHADPRDEQAS